jgi:hypothetical protein
MRKREKGRCEGGRRNDSIADFGLKMESRRFIFLIDRFDQISSFVVYSPCRIRFFGYLTPLSLYPTAYTFYRTPCAFALLPYALRREPNANYNPVSSIPHPAPRNPHPEISFSA